MSTGSLSKARLDRMHDVMEHHVERGHVPGLVTLVSRRGEQHGDVIGTMAVGSPEPMRRDTLFRITSMTKPVTAVATMILVEECRLRLDDPVDDLLPELADRRVLTRPDAPLDDTVPARRPITVRDLLTFRMGFGLILASPEHELPILQAIEDRQLMVGPPKPRTPHAPDEWMRRRGTLPLMRQPGETWLYNTGSQVLGVLIARASGQSLERFMHERIFEPLGMHDTGFTVPPDKLHRLASAYDVDPSTGALVLHDDGADASQWSRPPTFPDGGAGLVSTADDYLAFGQMLLHQGRHGRDRILSRLSVEAMTSDQLTAEQRATSGLFPGFWDASTWGFGVSIVTRRDRISAPPGTFGWAGGYGTSWASDPTEQVVGVLMTQRLVSSIPAHVDDDFWTCAYQAIDD